MSDQDEYETPSAVLLLVASYHSDISNALAQGAAAALEEVGVVVDRIDVPGLFELPGAVSMIDESGAYDAFVVLGAALQSDGLRAEIDVRSCFDQLQRLTEAPQVCLGNGIIFARDKAEAASQADPAGMNVGGMAAKAALEMLGIKQTYNEGAAHLMEQMNQLREAWEKGEVNLEDFGLELDDKD